MLVVKRNKSKEEFDINKIVNAVDKAFKSCGKEFPDYLKAKLEAVFGPSNKDEIQIEEIQNVVENILMDNKFFDVAKSYIIYRENHRQIREAAKNKYQFVQRFVKSDNTANATIDDNSNVGTKGIGVLNAEIHKEDNKNTNMYLWETWMHKLYPDFNTKIMENDFNTILYPHDASSQVMMPYCMAISMYPFLTRGLQDLGGKSAVPKNIDSFCGIYCNLIFALASEVKGAVATPEFLMYMDYFCRKEWGDDYYNKYDVIITSPHCKRQKTIKHQIEQYFQHVTYGINQIAGSRGMQSPFTNFSFFDKYFFEGMFGDFYFPDGTKPIWESTNWLQKHYLHWLNQERLKCMLTFPVCSYACLTEDGKFKDEETFNFICEEYAEGNSFFLYTSDSVDSLSSCCRLQNAISDNTFNFTNGQIGVMTGSKNVITLNLNRIIQDWYNSDEPQEGVDYDIQGTMHDEKDRLNTMWIGGKMMAYASLKGYLIHVLSRVYKYHTAYNSMLHWAKDSGLFKAYDAGFIDLDKQYLTIGINGLNQAAEFLGMNCNNNEEYKEFCSIIFETIKEQNSLHKTKHEMFNCEQVPRLSGYYKPSLIDSKLLKNKDNEAQASRLLYCAA